MNATRKTEVKDDNNQTNMLSIQEAIEGESVEKDNYSMQEEVDPFAEEENVQSETKTNANIFNPFDQQS